MTDVVGRALAHAVAVPFVMCRQRPVAAPIRFMGPGADVVELDSRQDAVT